MFTKGIKYVAGVLVAAVTMTTIPTIAFTAAEQDTDMWNMTVGFTAGAHHAMEDTVVLSDTERDYIVSAIIKGDIPFVASPQSPYATVAIANVDDYVNIRAAADENAEVLGKLYADGAANIIGYTNGWYKVTSGSVTGYIREEYLVVADTVYCEAVQRRVATITATSNLNLRKEASEASSVLASVAPNMKLIVVDESTKDWIKVLYNGKTGYISSEYATVETTYVYAESKEEEAARLAAEEAIRRAEEEARRAAEEAARVEANIRQQYINAANKTYYPASGTGGQAVVNYAMQFVGNPYVLGGSILTSGIDCSNFIMRIYEAFGVTLPHNSYQLRTVGYEVSASEIKPGDIICYQGHVSIYAGDGKCVHASNRKEGIKVSQKWNYTHVITIRRIFDN